MKMVLKYGWVLALVAGLCGGCKNGEDPANKPGIRKPLEIVAEITGAATAKSRTALDDFGSYDSNAGFSDGDRIGFYSMRDETGNENNGYVNLPVSYVAAENCFKNEALIVDYPNNFGYTFAYYPYRAENTESINIYRPDGSLEDLLIAGTNQLSEGRIYLGFVHAFSMLIIVPGNGFELAAENAANSVRVVLKSGMTASVVKNTDKGTLELALTRDDTAPKAFIAQRRTDVMYMKDGETIPFCYSVIVPNGAEIDHIEMTDNHGSVQYVDPQFETLDRGWRYPINVHMEGTTPTIWPYEIQPWISEEQPIVLGGTFGINTADDLMDWIVQYNRYTSEDLSEEDRAQVVEKLKAYGEMVEGVWHFQLNASIDCKDLPATPTLIAMLTDEFDGKNHTLSNLRSTLCSTIGAKGKLSDLNIDGINISSANSYPVGAIALKMTGGEVINCDIENIRIETQGPVGAIAGNATAGTISGNTVNGLLLGSESSADGITGMRNDDVTCENNRSSALIFNRMEQNNG